jgi:hypothetical protein
MMHAGGNPGNICDDIDHQLKEINWPVRPNPIRFRDNREFEVLGIFCAIAVVPMVISTNERYKIHGD